MSDVKKLRKIGVWGHYHAANLGDNLVVTALIQNIRARCPEAEIIGFSQNPMDTRERHGIPAFPLRWSTRERKADATRADTPGESDGKGWRAPLKSTLKQFPRLFSLLKSLREWFRAVAAIVNEPLFLWKSYRRLHGLDLVIVAGSNPLLDWGTPWSHSYTTFKWAMLARAAGVKFALLSVGAGPISFKLSRFFLRSALRSAHYLSFRDGYSARLVRKRLGLSGSFPVFADMAFSLDFDSALREMEEPEKLPGRAVVGLNLVPFFDDRYWFKGDSAKYRQYLRRLGGFVKWLLDGDYAVVLLYSQLSADPLVNKDFRQILAEDFGVELAERVVEARIDNLEDLVAQIRRCDYIVAGRFHCVLLPFMLGRLSIGLAYHPKTRELLSYLGQPDYAFDIEDFRSESLIDLFRKLERDSSQIRADISTKLPEMSRSLAGQYDQLLGAAPIESEPV
ncbi:MAG: hypothetical protein C4B58_13880 [Deltaproteobacteria bacterium]|nr:MAG: hypothetical protein C4B58_13880 [Deltaproteobacteria bacterium]